MKLNPPTTVVFLLSLVIAVAALLIFLQVITFTAVPTFWIMTAAWAVLVFGCVFRGA